jgi:hypothetical protein
MRLMQNSKTILEQCGYINKGLHPMKPSRVLLKINAH